MRILLTGGTGQVGMELRRALAPWGEVHAPLRGALDLSDEKTIVAAVRTADPHLIVNAGAYTDVDRAESEPALAMAVNGVAPGILAREAALRGAGMIQYSTDYVFDGRKATPYVEDDAPSPLNVYGATKLAGEQALLASDCVCLVLRTAWVYSSRGRNFLRAVLDQAQEGRRLEIVEDQFGAPTPAREVAAATSRILKSFFRNDRFDLDRMREHIGIFHMTAGGRISPYEFAQAILEVSGVKAEVAPVPAADRAGAARRPANCVLDNTRLRKHFGIALPDWVDGLRSTFQARGGPGY